MIDVEVFGAGLAPGVPSELEIRGLCEMAASSMGVHDAHVAIEFVDAARIQELNGEHRDRPTPTDVLSFPIDGVEPLQGEALPRELGDIVICPQHTVDLREAIVHGMLHLLGMDHETDDGEMLELQDKLLR
jgi:probable rRNA maturation factor